MRLKSVLLAIVLHGATAQPAFALLCGTGLDPVTVSATPVNFGSYMPTSALALVAGGTVKISCGLGLDLLPNFTVALSQGNGGSYAPRAMINGSMRLSYNLYTTAAYSTVWGDGTAGTAVQSYTSPLQLGSATFTAYGQLPAGQFAGAGLYTDTIVVTVTY